jgi:heptosyltransferase-2
VQKILVIQTAFIGDAVLATGILEKLHVYFPSTRLDLLVRKGNESLFDGHPWLGKRMTWDKKRQKKRNLLRLLWQIRREKYDKVINIQRFAATGFLTAFSGARDTIGFAKNPFSILFSRKVKHIVNLKGQPLHEIERNQELIREFTDGVAMKPVLYPSSEDARKLLAFREKPYITLSPASVWFTKQLPADAWIRFLGIIPSLYCVYLLGSPADRALCEDIRLKSARPAVSSLAGELSFLQSAELMKGAVMNYVNDSAPMHLASAVNAPVAAIFCSTIPAFGFGPLSDRHFIIETPERLSCRPCGLHGYKACPLGHFKCATQIGEGQLLAVLS